MDPAAREQYFSEQFDGTEPLTASVLERIIDSWLVGKSLIVPHPHVSTFSAVELLIELGDMDADSAENSAKTCKELGYDVTIGSYPSRYLLVSLPDKKPEQTPEPVEKPREDEHDNGLQTFCLWFIVGLVLLVSVPAVL